MSNTARVFKKEEVYTRSKDINLTTTRSFEEGQTIFKEGDNPNAIYLLKKGNVGVRIAKGKNFIEIARIYPNQVLGELSFFDRRPRSASAIALTDVELLEIKFDGLDKVYSTVPDYLKTIITSIVERLRKSNETIRQLQKNVILPEEKSSQISYESLTSSFADAAPTEPTPGSETTPSAETTSKPQLNSGIPAPKDSGNESKGPK